MRYQPAQMRRFQNFLLCYGAFAAGRPRVGCAALAMAAALCACAAPLPAQTPPGGALLYFPGPFFGTPDARAAYLVSTNFDQRFDAGWLTRIDLAQVGLALAANAPLAPCLARELFVPSLCSDALFSPTAASGYLSHRGNGYVTVLTLVAKSDGQHISCGEKGGAASLGGYFARTDCDADHLFDLKTALASREGILHRPEREQLDDPVAVVANPNGAPWFAYASDSRLVQITPAPAAASVQAVRTGPSGASFASLLALADGSLCGLGQRSGAGEGGPQESLLRVWPPGSAEPLDVFVSRILSDGRALDRAPAALLRATAAPALVAPVATPFGPMAGPVFGNDGRLFVLSQGPDALIALRPSPRAQSQIDDVGAVTASASAAGYELADAYPLPGATLTDVAYVSRDSGDLVVVSSLERDALYFFDVSTARLQLLRRLRLLDGRGPNRMLVAIAGGRPVLLVSTFYDHGLVVVDLSPSSATDFVAKSMHDDLFENALARP